MPGMCLPISMGGIGFDYRLGMGMPDFWIKTLQNKLDIEWDLGTLWHELTQRRPQEKVIGYCESHDQALVGDKTIMFRLADKEMYWYMNTLSQNSNIDRAMALHKMIRLITCTCAGDGYLNFMGNEFGHPEWIDFPCEENGWSYSHARRRWDLADDKNLRYQYLQNFDMAMINFIKKNNLLSQDTILLLHNEKCKIFIYLKGEYLFVFNFHPQESYSSLLPIEEIAVLKLILHSQWKEFGGDYNCKVDDNKDTALISKTRINIFIQSRSAAIYQLYSKGKHIKINQ